MSSKKIAELLLSLKAVMLNTQQPFRYTSGVLSPIYCDNRLVISYPDKRQQIVAAFCEKIDKQCDVIAGVATAGIPHAAWIADQLNKPMVYVRDKAKSHGKQNQIEGQFKTGARVAVIEDLISTGGSSIAAAQALRAAGAKVDYCYAIFSYELQTAQNAFAAANLALCTLSNFTDLIEVALEKKYISADEKAVLLKWQKDPLDWNKH